MSHPTIQRFVLIFTLLLSINAIAQQEFIDFESNQ